MGNKWKNLRSYWNKPQRAAYLFLLPAAILILVFNIIPLFASFLSVCWIWEFPLTAQNS